ncbi:MAG: DNA repair protein RadC [Lachnospiraceae bacterium]|nr:DNA repair protein RadC [Lachnospiraceae bacterium]
MHKKIKDLPESERPYEKALRFGVSVLSDAELLAVFLRNGTRELTAMELAVSMLKLCVPEGCVSSLKRMSFEELKAIPGIGKVKAIELMCLFEFSGRLWRAQIAEKEQFDTSAKCASYFMQSLKGLDREEVHLLLLDGKCRFLSDHCLSVGSVNASVVSPREVFLEALKKRAVCFFIVHNHPSGDPAPSPEDVKITAKLFKAGELMDIRLLDSLIIGEGRYVSLRANGLLQ